jgi:RNA polymerase sigma-70 factor, ECF subfamily
MGTVKAARGGRRHNLSLRQMPLRARREQHAVDLAFDTFYREHVAEVYQYALAVLTNPVDAEDVTQQTFLNAYRAFQKGERPHTPHNWLIKIAHNVCRMRWRQSSRRPQEVTLEQAAEPAMLEDEKAPLEEVLGALAELPFNQRAAIVMREVEGRSYAEIAEVLSTTLPAVEALLFRARTSLRARGKALGVLSAAPLPGSLTSFFGGSGGIAAAGGALAGSAVLKGAAIVAAGVIAGGVGFKTVKAVAKSDAPTPQFQKASALSEAEPGWANPVRRLAAATENRPNAGEFAHPGLRAGAGGGTLIGLPTNDGRSAESLAAAPGASGASAGAIQGGSGTTANNIGVSVPGTPTTPAISVPLPPPPVLPTATVTVPTATVPTVTVPTVTLPTVTVPTVTIPTVTVPTVTIPTIPTIPTVTLPPSPKPK